MSAAAVEAAKPAEAKKSDVTIEDANDDMPALEQVDVPQVAPGEGDEAKGAGKQNRSEKKARKALQRLGMKPVPGIVRVTIKKAKNILFVLNHPEVLKSPAADTYIMFGEAKIEESGNTPQQALQEDAVKALLSKAAAGAAGKTGGLAGIPEEAPSLVSAGAAPSAGAKADAAPAVAGAAGAGAAAPAASGAAVDETGLDADEINTIMSQANCSRADAVAALRKCGNIVDAILVSLRRILARAPRSLSAGLRSRARANSDARLAVAHPLKEQAAVGHSCGGNTAHLLLRVQ